jgi:hypothetical protein
MIDLLPILAEIDRRIDLDESLALRRIPRERKRAEYRPCPQRRAPVGRRSRTLYHAKALHEAAEASDDYDDGAVFLEGY